MSMLVTAILLLLAGIVAALVAVIVIEILAAILSRQGEPCAYLPGLPRGSVAVLIPAHNESTGLSRILEDVGAQLQPGDRILVVADNCTDDTAAVARSAGAEVIERHDQNQRGKGYALDFGIRHLAKHPPAILIIIDADCRLHENAIHHLANACVSTGRPAQALDLMVAPTSSANDHRLPEFAWRVKNWVRPLGLKALGLPCQLMGTGMAFPWAVIEKAELATGHIVEDLKLGLELARDGHPPLFCPAAVVTSEFPTSAAAAHQQRQRWEGGHLSMSARVALPLIAQAIARRNGGLLALALDIAVPPLTFLALCVLGVFVIAALAALFGLSPVPALISATSFAAFSTAVWLAWLNFGRDLLPIAAFRSLSGFVLRKIPFYVGFLRRRRPMQWIRTDRHPSAHDQTMDTRPTESSRADPRESR